MITKSKELIYKNKKGNKITREQLEKLSTDIDYTRIGNTVLPNGVIVSTVWLTYYCEGLLFETMIFRPQEDGDECYCERYKTEAGAIAGHKRVVEMCKKADY